MEALKLIDPSYEYTCKAWRELLKEIEERIDWSLTEDDYNRIKSFIEYATAGYRRKDFDVLYEGDKYNLQLTGYVWRTWNHSGDGISTPYEFWPKIEIHIGFYEATDEDGWIVRTDLNKWLREVQGSNYDILD